MTSKREGRRGRLAVGFALVGAAAIAAVAITPTAQAAEGQVRFAGSPDAIADSYIVVLKDTRAAIGAQSAALADRYDATVNRQFDTAITGFSATMSAERAAELAADPAVAYVQANQRFHATGTQENPPSWGLDRIDQADLPLDDSYTYPSEAADVTAYVIDTGVNAAHTTFGGRASGGFDAVDNDDDPDDGNGHGTHVAGTIGGKEYGVAKGVKIVPVRVLDDNGSGSTDGVVAGIEWVAENHSGASVANMSLGGPADSALDQAVKGAISAGVTFAVAAGNSGDNASGYSPARVQEAITVAASDDADKQAQFSSHGSIVDIYAPGVNITSSWIGSTTATNRISGTSMATPHVTGAAALYLAGNPSASPADVAAALVEAASADKISNPSSGTPNKLLHVGS
ncbi:subtilisin family serine protease [Actinokineospora baliensis]|uniref:S8 family peptidase n=1 Tax=Actinokineospora baliensis TaxID=547056 RepID=UPI001959FE74|nr:S8 family peptidase [Actinokineospora baliensis]MBM7772412.1 subtilisin family serine protease [Actinokineospora baliensis]